MGTFLGNLQVLGAEMDQIAALLPKAVVGCWSDRFVTVLEESYGFGSVEQPAKRLSKQLPQAVVLAVGLIDSDAVELSVWQAGKRLTAQVDEYEDMGGKKGDPKKFCAALGLPEEDVPRLKGVWTRGNAEEELELTAALLAAPLHCRVDWPPEERAVRDAAKVDEWLAQRPDPPKVKNQTKAELIQELAGVDTGGRSYDGRSAVPLILLHHVDGEGWYDRAEDECCCVGPDGTLEPADPKLDPRPEVDGLPSFREGDCFSGSWELSWLEIGNGRTLNLARQWDNYSGEVQVVEDSAGRLTLPFRFELDGEQRVFDRIWGMEDGGILIWYRQLNLSDCHGPRTPFDLVRCAPDGTVLWRRQFGQAVLEDGHLPIALWDGLLWVQGPEDFFSVDLDGGDYSRIAVKRRSQSREAAVTYGMFCRQNVPGEVWLIKETVQWEPSVQKSCSILRFDRQGGLLREDPLPDGVTGYVLDYCQEGPLFLPDRILAHGYDEGLWMLDRKDMSEIAAIRDHRKYLDAFPDGAGRIWVTVGGSTLEAYDQELKLLSRHRLKGYISTDLKLDRAGRLCVRTYDERKHILRAYRLS